MTGPDRTISHKPTKNINSIPVSEADFNHAMEVVAAFAVQQRCNLKCIARNDSGEKAAIVIVSAFPEFVERMDTEFERAEFDLYPEKYNLEDLT